MRRLCLFSIKIYFFFLEIAEFLAKNVHPLAFIFHRALDSGALAENALMPRLMQAHLERSLHIYGMKQSFISRYPDLTEFLLTLLFHSGPAAIEYLIGGKAPKEGTGSNSELLLKFKNLNVLTVRRLRDYVPRAIGNDQFDYFALRLLLLTSVSIKDALACFESPDSLVFLSALGADASQMIQRLSYSPHDHAVVGLESPAYLRYDDVSSPADRKALVDSIRGETEEHKFVNSLTLATGTVLGHVSIGLPLASFASRGRETADDMKARTREWNVKMSTCLDCLDNNRQDCLAYCESCSLMEHVCLDCQRIGHKFWYPLARPCFSCLNKKIKCVRAGPLFLAMDNCGTQLKLQKELSDEAEQARVQFTGTQAGVEILPAGDGIHNTKTVLITARNPLFWPLGDSVFLITVTLLADLAFTADVNLSLAVLETVSARNLKLLDKQDPENVKIFTKQKTIQVRLCCV